MTDLLARRIGLMLLVALGSSACASGTRIVPMVRPANLAATDLEAVRLPAGTDCIVGLVGGETLRGRCEEITLDRLVLSSKASTGAVAPRSIPHADITLVARIVKMSKGARGCLGAAIGALISVPLGISMPGDMVIPASLVGALIGRSTGDSHAEVVFERPDPFAGR